MSDVTFGVKVPEELRDQINNMMKASGLVGREFMQQLVDSYVMETSKQDIPEMAEEIKELQLLTHRINEIYVHLGTRFQTIIKMNEKEKSNIEIEIQQKYDTYDHEIKNYIKNLDEHKKQINQLNEKCNTFLKDNEQLKEEIQKLSDYNENYKELSNEYKNKINELQNQLEKYKEHKEDNENLRSANKTLQENNDTLASELWFCKREVEKLSEQISKNKKEYEQDLLYVNEQHNLEKQTIKLELQTQNQQNIELLNLKIVTMQEEYNNKLKEMIFQINNYNNTDIKK